MRIKSINQIFVNSLYVIVWSSVRIIKKKFKLQQVEKAICASYRGLSTFYHVLLEPLRNCFEIIIFAFVSLKLFHGWWSQCFKVTKPTPPSLQFTQQSVPGSIDQINFKRSIMRKYVGFKGIWQSKHVGRTLSNQQEKVYILRRSYKFQENVYCKGIVDVFSIKCPTTEICDILLFFSGKLLFLFVVSLYMLPADLCFWRK